MSKSYTRITVSINDLLLDINNPRFAMSLKNDIPLTQNEIIDYLLKNYKLSELAKGIKSSGMIFDSPVCYPMSNNKYIIAEGNRRICACKLMLDRSLIPEDYKKSFPILLPEDELYNELQYIEIKIFNDNDILNKYLINRHIETGIKHWTVAGQNNYYNRLYNEGKTALEISNLVDCTKQKVENTLYKYHFFESVIEVLKTKHKINTVGIDYRPLIDRFALTLVGNEADVGLNLEKDESNYSYYCCEDKKELYKDILMLVGETFFIRSDKDNPEKIKSAEIYSKANQVELIRKDIRIPGLYNLIKEYKGIEDTANNSNNSQEQSDAFDSNTKGDAKDDNIKDIQKEEDNSLSGSQDNKTTQNNVYISSDIGAKQNGKNKSQNTPKVNIFFGSLDFSNVKQDKYNGQGVLYVCNEIVKISRNFPL